MKIKALLALMLSLVFVSACSQKSEITPLNEVQKSRELISQGHYSEAIYILEERLARNPQDQEARVTLASAYAARAGLFMQDFIDVLRTIVESTRSVDKFFSEGGMSFDQLKNSNKDINTVIHTLEKVYKALFRINAILKGINLIPNMSNNEARADLDAAIKVLSEEPNLMPGPSLYIGFLRISRLKNKLSDPHYFDFSKNCIIYTKALLNQVYFIKDEMSLILDDFIRGSLNENRKSEVKKIKSQFNNDLMEVINRLGTVESGTIDVTKVVQQLNGTCQ